MVPRLERIPFNVTGFLSRGNLLADCVPISQISRLGLNQHRQPIQFRGPREKAYGHAKYFAGGSLTFPGSGPKCKENRNWNNTKDNCVAAKKKKVWKPQQQTDKMTLRPTNCHDRLFWPSLVCYVVVAVGVATKAHVAIDLFKWNHNKKSNPRKVWSGNLCT